MKENIVAKAVCPGQDTRFWRPSDIFEIPCAECGAMVEFFKDEARRRCPKCKAKVVNPKISIGCAQWCEHAKECLGFDPKEAEFADDGETESIVDRLTAAMKEVFGDDRKRVDHAMKVLANAKRILREAGGDSKVVIAAALLHDIGIPAAKKTWGSAAGRYQEKEGPPIAEKIMKDLDFDLERLDHVSRIIANHHSAKNIDTPEFRIIWDADWIENLREKFPDADPETLAGKIEHLFKTEAGKKLAKERHLN
jgi:putative nucleotidyltransferase with HDIG domain